MHPDLFSIGPLTLHTYGLFVALGFIAGIFVATRLGKTVGFMANAVMDMGFIIILTGLIGSRIVYIIIELPQYISNPLDIFKIWEGGLVFSGGLVAVIIAMIFYAKYYKVNIWTISDIWSPAAAIGQAIGRIGCFFAGCCYGRATDVPWGVVFTNPESATPLQNIPIHPTQLYSSLSSLIIYIILIILHSKKKFEGQVFLWFLILHSTTRLFIERFRGDPRGTIFTDNLTMTQFISIIILIGAVTSLFIFKPKGKK